MKKTLQISGVIHEMGRFPGGELMVTIKVSSGTYVNMAVGDLPITQEEIAANIGKLLSVKVEAEIDRSVCSEEGHVDDHHQEIWVHCLRCGEYLGSRDLQSGQIVLTDKNIKLAEKR